MLELCPPTVRREADMLNGGICMGQIFCITLLQLKKRFFCLGTQRQQMKSSLLFLFVLSSARPVNP